MPVPRGGVLPIRIGFRRIRRCALRGTHMCVPYEMLRSTDDRLSLRGPNGAVAISWQVVPVGSSLGLPRRPYGLLAMTLRGVQCRSTPVIARPLGAVAISWQWVLVGTSLRLPRRPYGLLAMTRGELPMVACHCGKGRADDTVRTAGAGCRGILCGFPRRHVFSAPLPREARRAVPTKESL